MGGRKRKGMIIKNTGQGPVELNLTTRTLVIRSGEEHAVTSDEVRDPVLRESLQVRAVSIVRPSTEAEEETLRHRLEEERALSEAARHAPEEEAADPNL